MRKICNRFHGIAVESLEPRSLFSATPTDFSVAVLSTTVPTAVVAGQPAHGSVTLGLTNLAPTQTSGPVTLAIYAVRSGSVISSSSALVVSATKNISIASSGAKILSLNVKSLPAGLADGTYTLLAQTTDSFNNIARSTIGPSVTVAAPFVRFAETEAAMNLPDAALAGDRTSASINVTVTNTGNIASGKQSIIDIFASTNGSVDSNSVLIGGVSRGIHLQPGKSATIPVRLGSFPVVASNTYDIIAQVTDQNSQVTNAPATVSLVIAPPFISLSDQLTTPSIVIKGANGKGAKSITATSVLKMTNNGTGPSSGVTSISIYLATTASSSTIFTAALKTATPTITIKPAQTHTFSVKSIITPTANNTPVYVIAKITDPDGNITYGIDPAPHDFFV